MKRRFRLTSPKDFERVRRTGKSYPHPLIVLVAIPNELPHTRIAVSASRAVGNAVQRNRAKRLLREAARPLLHHLQPGWDVVLIARSKVTGASAADIHLAVQQLTRRARLVASDNENAS